MIVTSKRAFLNVLTQLLDRDTLLNANYYLMDAIPTLMSHLNDPVNQTVYNEESGEFDIVQRQPVDGSSIPYTRYLIEPDKLGNLNGSRYLSELVSYNQEGAIQNFLEWINRPENLSSLKSFLSEDKFGGNGLQIMVFSDYQCIKIFGDIICKHLSDNFGYDVTFIDPTYHRGVVGQSYYPGNKNRAVEMSHAIRDYNIMTTLKNIMSSNYERCEANLRATIEDWQPQMLIYAYNLMFGEIDPLPPDNYEQKQLVEIFIHHALADKQPPRHTESEYPIWYNQSFDQAIGEYNC